MTSLITIPYADIIAAAHADLALIAKRLRTKDGNILFQNLTVSSVEDSVFKEYARQGAMGVLVKILKFVQGITTDDTNITFRVSNPRINIFGESPSSSPSHAPIDLGDKTNPNAPVEDDSEKPEDTEPEEDQSFAVLFTSVFSRYIVDYVLYEYLSLTVPSDALPQSFADRYLKDMNDRLAVVNDLLSHKDEPSSPASFDQNTATVVSLNPSTKPDTLKPSTDRPDTIGKTDGSPFSTEVPTSDTSKI